MFDPDRDEDPGSRRYWVRLFTVAAIAVAGGVALLPSVTEFSTGVDVKTCLAVKDGWHADRPGMTAAEKAAEATNFAGTRPSLEDQRTLERADAYVAWRDGPGACIPESRHRLILSGIGLASVASVGAGTLIVRRTRTSLRRTPAEIAGV